MATSLYRPPDKVVPFQCEMPPPIPGESLLGFLARAASRTTVNQLRNLLALGGCQRPVPTSVATMLTDAAEIAGVAKLIKVSPEDIRSRVYRVGVFEHTFSETIDFFGVPIRAKYRKIGRGRRRVSPRALIKSEHHRAIWEITAFSFDPETMETLLADCPVCGHWLGWRRFQGVAKCDRCRDSEGRASVDLRDFPQPIVETADPEALHFVVGLIDPIDEDKRRARTLLREPWSEFSNSDLFETVMALASGLGADPSSTHAQGRPKKMEEFARLTPDHLALAGRAIIGGMEGFSALAEEYRKSRDARPRFYGRRKEFGPLAYVPGDRHLNPKIRDLLSAQIKQYPQSRGIPGVALSREKKQPSSASQRKPKKGSDRTPKKAGVAAATEGFRTIHDLGLMFDMRTEPLTRLSQSGLVHVRRWEEASHSPVCMLYDEVAPAVELYKDSILDKEAAGTLGIPRFLLPDLADQGHLERLSGPVLGMLVHPVAFRRSSVDALRARFWNRVASPPPPGALRLKRVATSLGVRRPPWLAIVLAVLEGKLAAWALPQKRKNILKHLFVRDASALAEVVSRSEEGRLPEWIDIGTTADVLNVNEAFVWRLSKLRPDLLPKHDNGYTPFRTTEVEELARSYIFVPEISRRTGIIPRKVREWLESEGVGAALALQKNRQLSFLRSKVEPKIRAWGKAHPPKPIRTEPHSYETKMRVIEAVNAGASVSQAARQGGVGLKVALKWVHRWRETGSVIATGKSGYKSKLDDHVEWIRACIKRHPEISLSELVDQLKEEKKLKTSSTSVWNCLERHGIVLARRHKRRGDPPAVIAAE